MSPPILAKVVPFYVLAFLIGGGVECVVSNSPVSFDALLNQDTVHTH